MHTETINTGGGCLVEMIRLKGGEVIVFNDETLCLYQSEQGFWDNMDGKDVEMRVFYLDRKA
jgi:hypothetical protein